MSDAKETKITFDAYQPENLSELLEFVGECWQLDEHACFHPGDMAHWMSNTFKGHDLGSHYGFYRDAETGVIVALSVITKPESPFIELIMHPRYRGSQIENQSGKQLELDLLKDTRRRMLELIQSRISDPSGKKIGTTLVIEDTVRQGFLDQLGFQRDSQSLDYFNSRSLQDPIPDPALPDGFSIRNAAGEQEVSALVEVHNGSFGSKWTDSLYLEVMRTPGFDFTHEIVVVAPPKEGETGPVFAAFCLYWLDPVSRTGYFEPVGCHKDFQRMGLTKALMYATMQRMKAAGMEDAQVLYHGDNGPGKALYTSAGFRAIHEITEYYVPYDQLIQGQ